MGRPGIGANWFQSGFVCAASLSALGCIDYRQESIAPREEVEPATYAVSGENQAGTNLAAANLAGRNLGGMNLGGANLGGANLGGANLGGANLGGANLGGANLAG